MIRILFILFAFLFTVHAYSQHDQHAPKKDTTAPAKKETDSMHMSHQDMHNGHDEMAMSHSFSLNLPMTRNGSGTGWLPDSSPMFGSMKHAGPWMFMMHGSLFLRYNYQDFANKGVRGDTDFDAPNWFMLMGQRKVNKKGLFHFNAMLSLDPITQGGRGYPLLYQTGEAYKNEPIVDRQHPHDLFSELSVSYSHAFNKNTDAFIYIGYPGEPALGPVTFMHRPSALDNPNSPISHHWVDATHITFGVVTGGVRMGKIKLEASSFTGREPDDNRYDFDKAKFDSWSGRLSYNPTTNLALQVSHGYVKSPEELHPEENIHKTTGSVIYSRTFNGNTMLNATVLWGLNKEKDHKGQNAFLIEGALKKNRTALYTRYEFTEKSAEELVLGDGFKEHDIFNINAFTLGANYDLFKMGKIKVAGGGQLSIYASPGSLNEIYGKNPMSFQVYLRLYPEQMKL